MRFGWLEWSFLYSELSLRIHSSWTRVLDINAVLPLLVHILPLSFMRCMNVHMSTINNTNSIRHVPQKKKTASGHPWKWNKLIDQTCQFNWDSLHHITNSWFAHSHIVTTTWWKVPEAQNCCAIMHCSSTNRAWLLLDLCCNFGLTRSAMYLTSSLVKQFLCSVLHK